MIEHVPSIMPESFPKSQQQSIYVINGALQSITQYISDFSAALSLFEFSRRELLIFNSPLRQSAGSWLTIAARDGAMTIYHMSETIKGMEGEKAKCPALFAKIDKDKFKSANKRYLNFFPDVYRVRTSVAHGADRLKSSKKFDEHTFSGDYVTPGLSLTNCQKTIVSNTLEDDLFTTTWENKIVNYRINKGSLDNMISVKDELFDAFRGAELHFHQLAVNLKSS